jgi:hypothetical protein
MNVQVPVNYVKKRLMATDRAEVGATAARFMNRLEILLNLVKKYDENGCIEMNEGDAEMFDLYCGEPKAAVAKKPRQTKAKTKAGA